MRGETHNRKNQSMSARRWCEFVVLIFGCLAFGYVFSACSKNENIPGLIPTETAPPKNIEIAPVIEINPNADFSKFQHSNAEHARFPCALCHERKDNSATPKLSGHTPCSGCHTVQFADNKSLICTICHTQPETGIVKSFPALKTFNVVFDHAKHLRQTNCATCHKPTRNGVAQSILAGFNAHNTCFQCHSPGAKSGEREIDSCATCHQPGKSGKISDWSNAFASTPFSHAKHKLECSACHNVKAGAPRGNQVTAIVAKMHFPPKNAQSCASCHNNKRVFGGEDFTDCKRCHRGSGFKFS